jgi:hypothetical protein
VGVNAEKALTQRDKARNVEDGVRCELMKLHTVDKEQPTKKLVDCEREATKEKFRKHYPITLLGPRDHLLAWNRDHRRGGEEAGGAELP